MKLQRGGLLPPGSPGLVEATGCSGRGLVLPPHIVPELRPVVTSLKGKSLKGTAANDRRIRLAHKILDQMIEKALVKGFHGRFSMTIKVMDGTIQHVDKSEEESHR